MGNIDRTPFRVDGYSVEPSRNILSGPRGQVGLQPKVMDLLCLFAERHGQVLSRDEIIDRVWGVEFGGEESLTRAISQLRKAFGDSRENPRIIETIAKRGYRFVPEPLPLEAEARKAENAQSKHGRRSLWVGLLAAALCLLFAAWLAWRPSAEPRPKSARTGIVLDVGPFEADGASAPVGFAETLTADLARSPLVRARATGASAIEPQSDMKFRLRGSVHAGRLGRELQVQLIDLAAGDVVWGETYPVPPGSDWDVWRGPIDAVSSEVMLPLLRAAKSRLERRSLQSLEPWALTLLVTWVPGDEVRPPEPPHEDSYWLQKRALQLDPDFAPAHALFAELAAYHALFHPPADVPGARARAISHARRALELAPYDAEVLYQLGLYHRFAGERQNADAMLGRVVDLQPNHPLARLDRAFVRGQCTAGAEASIADIQRMSASLSASNPVRWVALAHLANLYLTLGDYEKARSAAAKSRQIAPLMWTAMTLAAADAASGRADEGLAVLAEHRVEWPRLDPVYFAERLVPRWCLGGARIANVKRAFDSLAAAELPRREKIQK